MKIPFWKMHGAANDFILVDDRQQTFPARNASWLVRIMSRHTGIGSDGILLIQPSRTADIRMRYFNPDGGEVDMCGNGVRCLARLANEIGAAPATMRIETAAGIIRAERRGELVLLHMTEPHDWRLNQTLHLEGRDIPYHFVNSGVPHVVVDVLDVAQVDVQTIGRAIRHHPAFAPKGTNVNFIHVTDADSIRVRTYERGVEAETLACGTGIVAAGLVAGKLGRVRSPVRITPASGDVLEVNFTPTAEGATDVTLLGPAVHVFRGELEYT